MSAAETIGANGTSTTTQTPSGSKMHPDVSVQVGGGSGTKRRTTIVAQTGEWYLGKTIGAGSMGKVKLAKNLETGEQVG